MKSLSPYLVKFSGLKEGIHLFDFEIGNKFFKNFDYYDFNDAKLFAKLELEKQPTLLNLKFSFHGEIEVQCDVSMENFNLELKTEHAVVVKYKDDIINDYQISRSFNFNFGNFIDQNFVVKDISKRNKNIIDKKLINTLLFFILFFSYVFLVFLNKNSVSTKYSLKKPIFVSLTILIYAFFIFNNSLSFYKQEFEFLGSIIAILFFFKVYMNE